MAELISRVVSDINEFGYFNFNFNFILPKVNTDAPVNILPVRGGGGLTQGNLTS